MANEKIMESRKALTEMLINMINNEQFDWKRLWKKEFMFPNNPVTGTVYKGINRLRLMITAMANDWDDPRYVTFKQATEKGWKVKKGEKGTLCEKYIFEKTVEETDDDGVTEKKKVELSRPIIMSFYVFNASQIEGIPEREKIEINRDLAEIEDIVENLVSSAECPVIEGGSEAYYSPSKDEIHMPLRVAFVSNPAYVKTLAHEMVHSTGHKDRLNRDLSGTFGTKEYAREELKAELGSLYVAAELGLDAEGATLENNAAYLQSWLMALENDANELFFAAKDAEKAADRIIEKYGAVCEKSAEQ